MKTLNLWGFDVLNNRSGSTPKKEATVPTEMTQTSIVRKDALLAQSFRCNIFATVNVMNMFMPARYQSDKEIEDLVKRFEAKTLPKDKWTHEAHLATGMYYLHHHSLYESLCIMKARIIVYNESVGGVNSPTEGYHETLTVFWLSILDNYLKEHKLETLFETCNAFFESKFFSKDLPLQYYERDKLFSVEARSTWVEP